MILTPYESKFMSYIVTLHLALTRNEKSNHSRENRFTGFDNLSKTHCTYTHSQYGSSMSNTCKKTNWDTCRDVCRVEIWSLTDSGGPHDERPSDSKEELGTSYKPMRMNHVGCFFVINIVGGVTGIPCCN